MTVIISDTIDPTFSHAELYKCAVDMAEERDELLVKLADERQMKSDLQKRVNELEQMILEAQQS